MTEPLIIEIDAPPAPAEVAAARRILARHGATSDQDILLLATCGTAENGETVMRAAGIVVVSMACRCCGINQLDPSERDALGLEMCAPCYEGAGLENEHSDDGHDEPVAGCPSCPS